MGYLLLNSYSTTTPEGNVYKARLVKEGESYTVIQEFGTPYRSLLGLGNDLKWRNVSHFLTCDRQEADRIWHNAVVWVDGHKDKGDK